MIYFRHTNIEEEFLRIKSHREEHQTDERQVVDEGGTRSMLGTAVHFATSGALMKPLSLSVALMVFQQLSGINAVIFYSATIFQQAGSSIDRFVSSITIGTVQLVCTMLSALSVIELIV